MSKKRIILAGGGDAADAQPLDRLFVEWLQPADRVLYIPVAMDETRNTYDACLDWFHSVYTPLGLVHIEMWTDLYAADFSRLDSFAAVYIGGGNTYDLLHILRASGFDAALLRFIRHGGMVYGGSAGAIVLGRNIDTCAHMDENAVGLMATDGLNQVFDHAIWCHYQPGDDERIAQYIARYGHPVLAISEHAGMQVYGESVYAIGFEPTIRFTASTREVVAVGNLLSYHPILHTR